MKKKPAPKKNLKKSKKIDKKATIDLTELERVYGGLLRAGDGTKGGIMMF